MGRAFDVIAVLAVAVVLLLPKPSLDAKPALEAEKIELDRIAALEDALFTASPAEEVPRATALADAYLRLLHPDWALGTLARFADRDDHRVHLLIATAQAERLQPKAAVDAVTRGLKACDAEGVEKCPPSERTRLTVISSGMESLLAAGVDPRKDPKRAREAVASVLHSTKAKGITPPTPQKK